MCIQILQRRYQNLFTHYHELKCIFKSAECCFCAMLCTVTPATCNTNIHTYVLYQTQQRVPLHLPTSLLLVRVATLRSCRNNIVQIWPLNVLLLRGEGGGERQCKYKHNTEARSRNHCCRRKAIIITYSECVNVALVIQHAMRMCRMCRIIFSSVPSLVWPYFSTLFHKRHDLGTKFII